MTDFANHRSDTPPAEERKFQNLLESAPDAIVIVDEQGKIGIVNSEAERMFGYSRSELIGEPVELLVPEMHRNGHFEHRARYMADPHTRPMGAGLDLAARHKDGTEVPVEISLSPLQTEEGLLVTSVIRDISDRKRSELALRESEHRFREFVEGTDDLVTRVDAEAQFIYVNETAQRIFGLTPEDCIGRSAFDFVHSGDRERTEVAFTKWVDEKVRSVAFENRQVNVDGDVHHMLWTINPQYDNQERLTSITSIARDITDRRKLEQSERERLEAQMQLEAERGEARMHREVLRRSIAAQEDERRRIARELHDETGQALTGVILGLGRIRSTQDVSHSHEEAERLREQVVRALRELRSLATRLRPTALDDLGLIPALEALAGQVPVDDDTSILFHHDSFEQRLEPTVETAIYRVIQEALTNAGKYAGANEITIDLSEYKDHISAVIGDDGNGFDPAAVSASALGIAGMRERASLVEGKLTVDATPGGGTKITLTVPLEDDE